MPSGHGRLRGIWQRLLVRRGSRCRHKGVAEKSKAAVLTAVIECIGFVDEAFVRDGPGADRVADQEELDIGPAPIVDTRVLSDVDGEEPCCRGIEMIRKEVDARLAPDKGGGLLCVVNGRVIPGAVGARGFVRLARVWVETVGDEAVMLARKEAFDIVKALGCREV